MDTVGESHCHSNETGTEMNSVVLLCSVLCHLGLTACEGATASLNQLHARLEQKLQVLTEESKRLHSITEKYNALRKKINEINDDTRITSFELNGVPNYCTSLTDRYIILDQFASAIGRLLLL